MIKNTFIIYDKIGKTKEKYLWNNGIKNWSDFLNTENIRFFPKKSKSYYDRKIKESANALQNYDSSYFKNKLSPLDSWRLYDYFRDDVIFLDIEISGSSKNGHITVFGMYDGYDTKIMIKDINLDFISLKKFLLNFKLIITFNGSSFDIPFIKKRHKGLIPDIPHFDLRHACKKVGLSGGLKQIEKKLGIRRNDYLENFDPISYWNIFRHTGNKKYLNQLIEYNEEDVINLKKIATHVTKELKKSVL
ncbi:hypothetical protein HN827_02905 [archaeon]|jgi:uncharacterized protein|nr:hypothetical protein [archaeon]MBT4647170.1 hypothetical protein [archaeon]MBT6822173.1 hypothetical protein [archaeon]MBT7391752.1 hypothetical protein [archaeon]